MNRKEKLIQWLFQTKAIKVSPKNKPFWYTSYTIGPYYVNTHFLYGSEEKANVLLKNIDSIKEDRLECSGKLLALVKGNYSEDPIYKGLIDEMVSYIKETLDTDEIDFISGGERRDWYFSLIIADILGKSHITLFKDLSAVLFANGKSQSISKVQGKVLHIADIITEASSYTRAWIPAIQQLGAELKWSLVVVDRLQGGGENLKKEGVQSHALIDMNLELFDSAVAQRLISEDQYELMKNYMDNPRESMRRFLINNPGFLEESLKADERTRERVRVCIEKDLYKLNKD